MNEPRWLDEREAAVWKQYRDLQRRLQSALDRQLARDSTLSGAEYAVLVPLSESPGDVLRARELQAELGWERSRLSHQISRMESRGLVAREPCTDDARGSMVRMTSQGRDAIEAAAPQHVETVRHSFFDPLSPDEVDTLGVLLGRLLASLPRDTD
ncbi:MarR family transcriptional regulator [Streptomyces sp. NBC_01005]|uniref:MarR family winged helix-turn-helix transcriptional regulator n=1 Tax=unclassified Streptomyces TaxID=2593676 RepID=UPI002E33B03C|nr:MarR family transcriptional regulator [Streptomyces sp. NBC_01362]WSW10145.1 MarR family transcriptional regulator [Streptomyces sp. NBC_01005]WTC99655.1 MarR family transcriptional regulator [Streptomyces sp. NBC_01650]